MEVRKYESRGRVQKEEKVGSSKGWLGPAMERLIQA